MRLSAAMTKSLSVGLMEVIDNAVSIRNTSVEAEMLKELAKRMIN